MWVLSDFNTVRTNAGDKKLCSTTQIEYDGVRDKYRTLANNFDESGHARAS
jgi:hypothetical protein